MQQRSGPSRERRKAVSSESGGPVDGSKDQGASATVRASVKAAQISAPKVATGGKAVAASVKGAKAAAPHAKTAGKLVVDNHLEIAVGVAAVGRAISNAKAGDDYDKAPSKKPDSGA